MRAHCRRCLTLTLLTLSFAAPRLHAATFTDRSVFNAAVAALGDPMVTIIPGGTASVLPGPTYATNAFDYGVSIDGVGFLNPDAALGYGPSGLPVTLSGGVLLAGFGISPLQVILPDHIYAVGYDLRYVNDSPDYSFFGTVSNTPITTFLINGHPGSSNFMQLQNFAFGPAAAATVPEPETPMLLGVCLVATLPAVRRRRA